MKSQAALISEQALQIDSLKDALKQCEHLNRQLDKKYEATEEARECTEQQNHELENKIDFLLNILSESQDETKLWQNKCKVLLDSVSSVSSLYAVGVTANTAAAAAEEEEEEEEEECNGSYLGSGGTRVALSDHVTAVAAATAVLSSSSSSSHFKYFPNIYISISLSLTHTHRLLFVS